MKTVVIRSKGFKFRLEPNEAQRKMLTRFVGHARFVWNKALDLNLWRLKNGYPIMRYAELCHWLTIWKQSDEYGFLKEAPSQVLQQKLKDLDRAFRDAFDKNQPLKRLPSARKKGKHDSIRFPESKQIKLEQKNNRIFLPKLGWMRYRNSREVSGTVKNVTVSHSCGHWYISIQTEITVALPQYPTATSAIGVDMGVAHTVTLSDGTHLDLPKTLVKLEEKIKCLQRALSRKVRFSSNWRKLKQKIARLHHRIANIRRDFLHKASTRLSKNHALVVVEDLRIKNRRRAGHGRRFCRDVLRWRGMSARMACGSNCTSSRKQEPAEAFLWKRSRNPRPLGRGGCQVYWGNGYLS